MRLCSQRSSDRSCCQRRLSKGGVVLVHKSHANLHTNRDAAESLSRDHRVHVVPCARAGVHVLPRLPTLPVPTILVFAVVPPECASLLCHCLLFAVPLLCTAAMAESSSPVLDISIDSSSSVETLSAHMADPRKSRAKQYTEEKKDDAQASKARKQVCGCAANGW